MYQLDLVTVLHGGGGQVRAPDDPPVPLGHHEAGIEPEKPPYTVGEGGSRICFVRDPDGYRIELIERA